MPTTTAPQRTLLFLLAVNFACTGCSWQPADRPASLRLFTATSTAEAVRKVAAAFTDESGIPVEVNPGPSSGLARQIAEEAPADVFFSADLASVDYLAKKGLVAERRDLLTNRLVVIVPAEGGPDLRRLEDLAGPAVRRLAVGEGKVPVGEYARQALARAGVLDRVRDRLVGGIDVAATLQHVARGDADAGIVYATDPVGNSRVRVAFAVDPALHAPVVYPLVLLRDGSGRDGARRLYEHLASPAAADTFREAGFGLAQ